MLSRIARGVHVLPHLVPELDAVPLLQHSDMGMGHGNSNHDQHHHHHQPACCSRDNADEGRKERKRDKRKKDDSARIGNAQKI